MACQIQNTCPCHALPSEIDSGSSQSLTFSCEPLSHRHQTQIKFFKRVSTASRVLVLACAQNFVLPPCTGGAAHSRNNLYTILYLPDCWYCLYVLPSSAHSYLDSIERAVSNGDCLLLESIGESVDPVLDPLLGRLTIKKGKYIKIGDREVEYHSKFRLILQVRDTHNTLSAHFEARCII